MLTGLMEHLRRMKANGYAVCLIGDATITPCNSGGVGFLFFKFMVRTREGL